MIPDKPFKWLSPVTIFDWPAASLERVDGGLTLIAAPHDL